MMTVSAAYAVVSPSSKQVLHQAKHRDIAWGKLVLQTATPTMIFN